MANMDENSASSSVAYGEVVAKILVKKEDIQKRVKEVAEEINRDYRGKPLLLVCILRGSVIFFADLFRELSTDVEVDFISVSSYQGAMVSSGEVKLVKDLSTSIEGKNVLIIEDIVDTGLTLTYLKRLLESKKPLSVKICTMLDKRANRIVPLKADYVCYAIPNEFVVGYGMDYNEKYRNFPDICVLSEKVYKK